MFHDEGGLSRLKTGGHYNNFIEIIYISYILRTLKLEDLKSRYLPVKRTERKENGYEKE